MLGLFSRSQRKSPPAKAGSFRPSLERLEDRDCPSTITLMVGSYMPGSRTVMFGGQVTNTPLPGGLTVQLTGEVSGTTTTDSNGSFHVALPAAALGTVYAATTDGQSNTAQVTLTDPAPPNIDYFNWMEEPNHVFVFGGHVTNGYQGEVVTLGGIKDLKGQTVTVDSYGNFQFTVQLDGLMDDNGNATAQTTDCWNVTSNLAMTWVTQTY